MASIKIPHLPIDNFNKEDIEEKLCSKDDPQTSLLNKLLDECDSDSQKTFKDVGLILCGMGLEKYIELFQNENVDLDTFLHLNEQDLKELGITDTKDRQVFIKNLKFHQTNTDDYTVAENHLDDFKIAKNVYSQLLLLQNYSAYVELQMKKHKLTDYRINSKDFALNYLRAFTESALTQAQLMSDMLFKKQSSNHLIGKVLKVNNLTLPKNLEEKLYIRKPRKKKIVLKVAVVVGFSSIIVLIGKYLINKK